MSAQGTLRAIWIAPEKGAPMISVPEALAMAGQGLFGDRNFARQAGPGSDKDVTLIEAEQIARFVAATGLPFTAADARRNFVTSGIDLNPLLGREFVVGEVRVQALELCQPCSLLAKRTHRAVLWALRDRGGLRCRILCGGVIRVGDGVGAEEGL